MRIIPPQTLADNKPSVYYKFASSTINNCSLLTGTTAMKLLAYYEEQKKGEKKDLTEPLCFFLTF